MHLHGKISSILRKPPSIAIPIDDIPSDLTEWARTLRNPVRIWRLEKYSRAGGSEILYSLPDEAVATTGESPESSEISATRFSGGESLRRVIRAGLLQVGQELHMEYGPKGKPKQRFTAIVREDGLEVDGKVYSPSYAAVACIRKTGSDRETANGWVMWRTSDGVLIDELLKKAATGS